VITLDKYDFYYSRKAEKEKIVQRNVKLKNWWFVYTEMVQEGCTPVFEDSLYIGTGEYNENKNIIIGNTKATRIRKAKTKTPGFSFHQTVKIDDKKIFEL
jgi:hypothetical protein